MKKLIIIIGVLFLSLPLISQDTLQLNGSLGFVSRYIWRGQDLGKSPSIQPNLSVAWKGFTFGTTGAYKFTPGDMETDFYFSKTIKFVTLGITDVGNFNTEEKFNYFDYNSKTTKHFLDAQLTLSGGNKFPFNLFASYLFYGMDTTKSVYLEGQFAPKFKWLDLLVFAGYQAKGEFYTSKRSFVNVGFTIKKCIPIGNYYYIPITFTLVTNPASKSMWLIGGISL